MPKVTLEYKKLVKDRILQSALEAFSKKGYADTTLDDIAQPLGITKPALYRYFESKEALFKELMKVMVDAAEKAVRGAFQETKFDSSALFSALKQWIWTPTFFFTAATEATKNRVLKRIFKEGYESAVGSLAKFVDEQKKRGIMKKELNSRHIAMGAIALHDGLLATELADVEEKEREEALADTFRVMLDGMTSGPQSWKYHP